MSNTVKMVLKGVITGSTMIATNEVIGSYGNLFSKPATTKLACNIASASIGYFVGRKVADYCVEVLDGVISGYNKEA